MIWKVNVFVVIITHILMVTINFKNWGRKYNSFSVKIHVKMVERLKW
jgi:hypothetical protein